jgi:hypothetical protein
LTKKAKHLQCDTEMHMWIRKPYWNA